VHRQVERKTEARAPVDRKTVPEVAFSLRGGLRVRCHDQSLVPRRRGAPEQRSVDAFVAERIELEPAPTARRSLGEPLDRGIGSGGEI
jgi:hypothetical protein